jgi:hypothetical protein
MNLEKWNISYKIEPEGLCDIIDNYPFNKIIIIHIIIIIDILYQRMFMQLIFYCFIKNLMFKLHFNKKYYI